LSIFGIRADEIPGRIRGGGRAPFGSAQRRHRGALRAIGIGSPISLREKKENVGLRAYKRRGRARTRKKVALQVVIKPWKSAWKPT